MRELDQLKVALGDRYSLREELGRGGMATVYLADDERHHRRVAIKVVRPDLAATLGPERFLREIEVTAGLVHPHIVPLLDSGEAGGRLFYVMPYVEGESLRARLTREKQLPLDDALQIAREVADALGYAHGRAVVHRDVKPENILLAAGHALMTDFGIAQAVTLAGGERLTGTGVSVGTPEYMSPEQATGAEVDARSDIYALGAVTYEMLSGSPPHTARTSQAVVVKVLTERPVPLRALRDTVPEAVDRAVLRSLAKVPADRFATTAEFARELQAPAPAASVTWPGLPRRRRLRRLAAYALAGGALVAAAVFLGRDVAGRRPEAATAGGPSFRQLTFTGHAIRAAISPDGRFIAYAATPGERSRMIVKLQELAGGRAIDVTDSFNIVGSLRFSRDGSRLLVPAIRGDSTGLYIVPLLGGEPRRVAQLPSFAFLASSPDGQSVAWFERKEEDRTLLIVQSLSDDGRSDTTAVPLRLVSWPDWSPDGRWIAVTHDLPQRLSLVSRDGKVIQPLVAGNNEIRSPRWSARGDAIYYAQSTGFAATAQDLMKVPVNTRTGRPAGAPVLLAAGLPLEEFDVAADGRLMVHDRSRAVGHVWAATLAGIRRGASVAPTQIVGGTGLNARPVISPDGRSVAFIRGDEQRQDLYVVPVAGGTPERVTFLETIILDPAWSPDGASLAFGAHTPGGPALMAVSLADRQSRRMSPSAVPAIGDQAGSMILWTRAGVIVFVATDTASRSADLRVFDPSTGREAALALPPGYGPVAIPVASADGQRVVVVGVTREAPRQWGRFIVSLADGSARPLGRLGGTPALWPRADLVYVVAKREGVTEVWSVSPDGGRRVLEFRLPIACGSLSLSGDLTHMACDVWTSETDLWLAENLDPGRR